MNQPPSVLAEALGVLAAWRRVILALAAGVTLVALIYAIAARPVYLGRATLLPQQEDEQFGSLSSLVANQFGSFAGGLTGMTTSTDILMTILESRRLRERLIERFDLENVLGIRARNPGLRRQAALDRLDRMTRFGVSKRLSIYVDVRAPSPRLAADLANACLEELDRINRDLELESARQKRKFAEERVAEVRDSLTAVSRRLEEFQRKTGMVALDEQARIAVEAAARVQGEILTLESQLEVQRRYATGSYSRTRDLEYRIDALRNRMVDLVSGGSPGGAFRTFAELPELGRRLAELMLDVRTQETVYALVSSEYHQSRLEEARDVPTVQVLDRATPPADRASPRRKRVVLTGLVAGLAAGLLLAFALEQLHRAFQDPRVGDLLDRLLGPAAGPLRRWLAGARS